MRTITRFIWDEPESIKPNWVPSESNFFVLVPTPTNHNQYLLEAGLSDFCDPDESWHTEYRKILSYTLDMLICCSGPIEVISGEISKKNVGILEWIFGSREKEENDEDPYLKLIESSSVNDKLEKCIFHFGSDDTGLMIGNGRPILWFWFPEKVGSMPQFLNALGDYPIERKKLNWKSLL